MTTIPATIPERVPLPSVAVPGAEPGAAFSAGDILHILLARLVMIVLFFLFFSAVAIGLFVLVYFKFPTYYAEAIIECISSMPKAALTLAQREAQEHTHERFLKSQALYVLQPIVLQDVIKSPEVQSTSWYASVDKDRRLLELEEDLGSSPIRDSNYIRVAMGTRDPGDPHRIVRQVVDTYLQHVRERATEQYRNEQTEYVREESRIKGRIQDQIQLMREFRETLPPGAELAGDRATGRTVVGEELITAQAQVTELELQTLELEGIQSIYEDPEGPGVTPEDQQMVELNPQVMQLMNQVYALEQELSVRSRRFGPEHREMADLRGRLEETKSQLDRMRGIKLEQAIGVKREQVRTAYLNSQHALLLARERLVATEAKQADIDRKQSEYERLEDELEFLKETQVKVSDYIRDLKRIVAERTAVQIKVLQWPTAPIERSQPRWYHAAAGIVLALALSIGLAILFELLDTSVRTPRDVIRHLNMPILGTVPDADDEEVDIECIERAVCEVPHSMIAEAFRAIRTNLQFSAPAERMRSVLVTSPKPEDGKTAVACNLAASLANSGRRVLLVDANFRRPAIHNFFAGAPEAGLSNILVASGRLTDYVVKTEMGNLDVLSSGPTPPNPAERLGSQLMCDLLNEAANEYDQVVIDTPPVLLASDASVLATAVDGVILVLRARENSRGVARRAISLLNHVNAHLFGAVLNAAQVRRGGYFREQLRTFYDYQSQEALEGDMEKALPPRPEGRTSESDAGAADSSPSAEE